jgi:hypothetical protein
VVAGSLVAVVTAVLLILPVGGGDRLGAPEAGAVETLRRAAAVEQGGIPRPLRAGEYWYVRRQTLWGIGNDDYFVSRPAVREDWVGIDGTRRWRSRPDGSVQFPAPADRERWIDAGRPPAGVGPAEHRTGPERAPSFLIGDEELDYAQLLGLPRDPEALYKLLRRGAIACQCGSSVEQATFTMVGDLLRDPPITNDLRAALLRAAALIPGIKLIEREQDLAGRRGVGVAFDDQGRRDVLVFDARTYELLGENERLTERVEWTEAEPGTLVGGSADLESGIVGSLKERP